MLHKGNKISERLQRFIYGHKHISMIPTWALRAYSDYLNLNIEKHL